MSADDFGRLGELMRRGGVWRGRAAALAPVRPRGGRAGARERLLRLADLAQRLEAVRRPADRRPPGRPTSATSPRCPPTSYQYAGLFGQWVTVFPSQGVVVVRTGDDTGTVTGDTAWQEEMYRRDPRLDHRRRDPLPEARPRRRQRQPTRTSTAASSRRSRTRPSTCSGGAPPPLPPAGPARARATLIKFRTPRVGARGTAKVRLRCPRALGARPCGRAAAARLGSARQARPKRYRIAAGRARTVRLRLRPRRCGGSSASAARAHDRDSQPRSPRRHRRAPPDPAARRADAAPALLLARVAEDRAVDQPLDRGPVVGVDRAAGQPRADPRRLDPRRRCAARAGARRDAARRGSRAEAGAALPISSVFVGSIGSRSTVGKTSAIVPTEDLLEVVVALGVAGVDDHHAAGREPVADELEELAWSRGRTGCRAGGRRRP